MQAIGQHLPVEAVQRAGCETLRVLAQREECRAQAMGAGVLSALVAASSAHELVEDIQVSAAATIQILVATTEERSGFAASGAVQAVIDAMRNRPSTVPLIIQGTQAALSFARDKECRAKVRAAFCHMCDASTPINLSLMEKGWLSICYRPSDSSLPVVELQFSLQPCGTTPRKLSSRRRGARHCGGSCSVRTGEGESGRLRHVAG